MKKYLIFAMLLLTVLACKPKQKPGVRGVISGGGGTITPPPTVQTKEEGEIKTVFTSVVRDYDRTDNGWKDSEWKDIPRLTESDIGQITDGGFFVSQYSKENWIVFAINSERNVYTGLSQGAGKLQEAIDMLVDTNTGKLKEEAWDPRKLLFNQVQDLEDPDRLLSISWLGRAMWDDLYADQDNTSYREFDDKYPNALKYLQGDAKTYGTIRNYRNEKIYDYMLEDKLRNTEGHSWANTTFMQEEALGDQPRKVWVYFIYDTNRPGHLRWGIPGAKYKQSSGETRVSQLTAMRFAYAGPEGGYPGGEAKYNFGTRGTKATPKGVTWADRQPPFGKYYDGYDTRGSSR